MNMPAPTTITVSSKGQIAIPKEFRTAAGLEAGTKIILECLPDGTLELHPMSYSIGTVFGIGKKIARHYKSSDEDKDISTIVAAEDELTKKEN